MEDLGESYEMCEDHLRARLANGLVILDGEQYPQVELLCVEYGDLRRVEIGRHSASEQGLEGALAAEGVVPREGLDHEEPEQER